MPLIIKNSAVIEDSWQLLHADSDLEHATEVSQPIVPLSLWQAHSDELKLLPTLGIWLESHEAIEDIADALPHFAVVALDFPSFTDGRHFSSAHLLRERYAYSGEVRAIGDVMRDQLYYLQRCGFDAFAVRQDRCPYDALKGLTDFSVCYQSAADKSPPLFRQRTSSVA